MIKVVSHWLICRAARRAPPDLSDRLAEEWVADCAARMSAPSRLRFAIGCCWASQVLAREHGSAMIAVVAAARGTAAALTQLSDDSALISRRSSLFFLAAGVHVAMFYVLMTGFAFRLIATMAPQVHP